MTLREKGRSVPPLPRFEFSTGVSVQVRKVGLTTQQAIIAALREEWKAKGKGEPQPPVHRVNYGTDEEPDYKEEPNAADPAYATALAQWSNDFYLEVQRRVLTLAALEAEFDVDQATLARRRRHLARVGVTLEDDPELDNDENAKVHYFFHVVAAVQSELMDFYQALSRRSQPTEEAVQAHIASFPGDLEGARPL